ncbi:DinB family protein [Nocardioides sp. zg-1228]|uniref:DinB family protein n=1 Tax=Nocardioides sp. zg-1228 TaxID=2763008 RepID=UPI00164330FA|nr:DinB family protein [Nocardioides sp. zg-1228]MBC2932023.1 DinB family protein [Nocardioides sp. zg-1228]QSF57575.1 DinB family protein [Nocardioides sp. zg-1228]
MTNSRITQLAEQLDWHWTAQLRPRFDGLTDDEYFFEPVPGCWTIRRHGTRMVPDFADPPPQPEPLTTIAWRMAHVIVGVLATRAHSHFGGPPADYESWDYAADADTALRQLDDAYRLWRDGVHGLADADLDTPVGPAEGPWAAAPMATLILHINREVIHHGAEIALLRDLYAHTPPTAAS